MISKDICFCITDFETTGISEISVPIEIGCIWTDSEFSILDTFQSFIEWKGMANQTSWTSDQLKAFEIHKIDFIEYSENSVGRDYKYIADHLFRMNEKFRKKYKKVIMISDNAQFETFHMKKICGFEQYFKTFHYCTWDSSLLLELVGVKDPIPEHRAFRDAALLQAALVKASYLIQRMNEGKN